MLSFLLGIIIVAAGAIAAMSVDCFWGLAAFACLTHITPQQLGITQIRPAFLLAMVTLLSYLLGSLYNRKFSNTPVEFWLFVVMVLGMFMGAYNAYDRPLAMSHFIIYVKYLLYFWLLINIINSAWKARWFVNALMLSAAWLVYKCWDLRGTTGARFENIGGGVVGDGNQYAAALILLLPLVVVRILHGGRWYIRVGAVLGVFGMVMSILITVSRGGFLGLAALVVSFAYFFRSYRLKIIITMFAVFISVYPFLPPQYIDRISGIFDSTKIEEDTSSQSRLAFWSLAVDVWKRYPVYGCGLRNFIYYSGYECEGKEWGEQGHVAHSLWFEALGEGGVMVFIPLVGMIGIFFYRCNKCKRKFSGNVFYVSEITALQIGMIGFLVSATFINRLIYEPLYWWFGLAYVYHKNIQVPDSSDM